MKKVWSSLLTFVVVFSLALPANAVILDFEDLDPGYVTGNNPLPTGYAGLNWSTHAYWMTSQYSPGSGYEYGTIGNVNLYTNGANDISMGGDPFDFVGAYITAAWDVNESVAVEGWREGSLVYSQNIVTSNDSAYWFDFNFQNVDEVWFRPDGNHIVLDNVNVNPVPEPLSLLLYGAGLIGIAGWKKKKG